MKCPYCNEEMEKRLPSFGGVLAEVDMCPNCKKIVVDIEKNAR